MIQKLNQALIGLAIIVVGAVVLPLSLVQLIINTVVTLVLRIVFAPAVLLAYLFVGLLRAYKYVSQPSE